VLFLAACSTSTKITVTSTPSGANVSEAVFGDLGLTPVDIEFKDEDCVGDHEHCMASFYFSKPGFQDRRVEKYVDGDSMLVHAYLFPEKTKLEIKGFPAFANLDVKYQGTDGKWQALSLLEDDGKVPSLEDEQPWGGNDYCLVRIIAESPGYEQQEQVITIHKGDHKIVEYVLNEYAVTGEIISDPPGADVYERSLGYLGRTPFKIRIPYDQLMRISAQRKQSLEDPVYLYLKFIKKGYISVEQISSIGEITESEEPVHFSIPANLKLTKEK